MLVDRASSQQQSESAFDRLYRKGLVVAAKQQIAHEEHKKREAVRHLEETEGIGECTFHPRINLTSSSVAGSWDVNPMAACHRLYRQGQAHLSAQYEMQLELQEEVERERQMHVVRMTDEERQQTMDRLHRMKPRRAVEQYRAIEERQFLRHQTPPVSRQHAVDLSNRLYRQAEAQRRQHEVERERHFASITKACTNHTEKGKGIIKERGGPSCVSGNMACRCPEHRHHVTRRTAAHPHETEDTVKKVRTVSSRLLTIPAHRLSERHADPQQHSSLRSAHDWFESNQHQTTWEPSQGRLTLEELERHARLTSNP